MGSASPRLLSNASRVLDDDCSHSRCTRCLVSLLLCWLVLAWLAVACWSLHAQRRAQATKSAARMEAHRGALHTAQGRGTVRSTILSFAPPRAASAFHACSSARGCGWLISHERHGVRSPALSAAPDIARVSTDRESRKRVQTAKALCVRQADRRGRRASAGCDESSTVPRCEEAATAPPSADASLLA